MANRYWVGGTGTWNTSSTTNWSSSSGGASGASVPTAADSVFFDQATTYTVTLTGALTCLSLTVSAGTVTFTSTGTIAISGSMSLVAATVWNATGTITFNSTSAGNTITTNAVSISASITFNGVGGTWQLQAALTSSATRTCTLTNGTLDLASYTLTTGLFSSSNSNTRTLAMGTGKIVITGNNATIWVTSTGTALTVTGSKRVELSYSGGTGTRNIQGPTNATVIEGTNLLDYYVTAGSDSVTFISARNYGTIDFSNAGTSTFTGTWANAASTSNVYGDLILSSIMTVGSGTEFIAMKATSGTKTITSAGKTMDFPFAISGLGGTFFCSDALTLGSTQTFSMQNGTLQLKSGTTNTVGSFVTTGTTQKFLQSTTNGSQATLSQASGTVNVTYLTIKDSAATGGAVFNAFTSNANVNSGNNTGWKFGSANSAGGFLQFF